MTINISVRGKRLTRSRDDRMAAGICGGLGHFLDVDPTLVRLAFAILTVITSGAALVAYLIAWIIVPEEGSPS